MTRGLELRIVAGQQVGRLVLDLHVGVDAVVLDGPLAVEAVQRVLGIVTKPPSIIGQ